MPERALSVTAGDTTRSVRVNDDGTVVVGDDRLHVTPGRTPGELIVSRGAALDRAFAIAAGDTTLVFHDGDVYELTVEQEGSVRRRAHHQGSLTAPMPATVVSVHARTGDQVKRGATLIVLEAMKMELPVRAPSDGTVTAVNCNPGDLVQPGVPLLELK